MENVNSLVQKPTILHQGSMASPVKLAATSTSCRPPLRARTTAPDVIYCVSPSSSWNLAPRRSVDGRRRRSVVIAQVEYRGDSCEILERVAMRLGPRGIDADPPVGIVSFM